MTSHFAHLGLYHELNISDVNCYETQKNKDISDINF